nr:MAG TPA: hypothetical protein [Caudoviricetes sp.]
MVFALTLNIYLSSLSFGMLYPSADRGITIADINVRMLS